MQLQKVRLSVTPGVRVCIKHAFNAILIAFPWLRKKASNWSLRSLKKANRSTSALSTVSISPSVESSACSSISSMIHGDRENPAQTIPDEIKSQVEQEEAKQAQEDIDSPPCYDDPSHPWIFQFPKSLSNRIILPREEEGNEKLPDYECTINKMSYTHVKCEFSKPGIRSKSRSWRDLYVVVFGTKISAYEHNPKFKESHPPIWSYSMQGAQVTMASDYVKLRHVIRLNIQNGPQFLMTAKSDANKIAWMGILESSIHISSDLDVRSMPQFITLMSRRRRRQQRRLAQQQIAQTETLV
ncbi:hypothetical protein [Parasitella parasitica]|uniref:PH domain-containing protein n=1 Tax=Parasitella parasitica TaxID=35722 RepID=A0A0B7MXS0_9FUNG|nr:hypothetical protein [Parasitella parasitica]